MTGGVRLFIFACCCFLGLAATDVNEKTVIIMLSTDLINRTTQL